MILDCLIIGGGPAGLTAALYLGRFLRKTLVIDSGSSRARYIPTSHNYPGFPQGMHGADFLKSLRAQVADYDVEIRHGEVTHLSRNPDGTFTALCGQEKFQARTVILATGMVDEKPNLPNIREFIYNGVVRFCPICDGYEAMDKIVGIIGPCDKIYKKACFLRTYTGRIELFPLDDESERHAEDRRRLESLKIPVPACKISDLVLEQDHAIGVMEDGRKIKVDILYPAMGAKVRTDIIMDLGAQHNESGCIFADAHQQTNIEGLYAIGDITVDLSQISVGTGQAAIAATSVHNFLPTNCKDR